MKTQKEMVEIAAECLRFIAKHAYETLSEYNCEDRDIFVTIDENGITGDWSFERHSLSEIKLPRPSIERPWLEELPENISVLLIEIAICDGLLLASAEVLREQFARAVDTFYSSNGERAFEEIDEDEYDRICNVDAVDFNEKNTIWEAQEAGREAARLYIAENELSYPDWKDIVNEKSFQLFPENDENRTESEWERFVKDSIQLFRRWGNPLEIRESVEEISKQWRREQDYNQLLILPEL